MSESHPAAFPVDRLLADCDVIRQRRGGPGGQHRNKVETAVVVRHRPTGLQAEASQRRSQAENHHRAIFQLRVRLALQVRMTPQTSSIPSNLWKSRAAGRRIEVSRQHQEYPTLLAEALDVVVSTEFDLPRAAESLTVSTSQLTRFLRREPAAWKQVNEARKKRGLTPLK